MVPLFTLGKFDMIKAQDGAMQKKTARRVFIASCKRMINL
jgi:hypothetical protein